MMAKLNQAWDLASIFPGGSGSHKLQVQLNEAKAGIKALGERISKTTSDANSEELLVLVNQLQDVMMGLNQCGAFVGCLVAQDVKDGRAKAILAHISQTHAELASVLTQFDQLLVTIPNDRWESLFQDSALKELAFPLKERRTVAKQKLPPEQEALAADLAVDGYHAWSQLYNTVVGRMTVTIDHDGKEKKLSVGQASNLLSEPDRDLRKRAFYELEKVWANEAELCADALNHLAGFRINLYKNRGWDDVLQEPLQINRMSRDTLDAMWDAIEKGKPKLAASAGVYAQAVKEGPGFADRYRNLLLDTARMSVEELAQKHLDVDLTKGEFWHGAVELVTDDVDEFLRLTAEK